MVYEEWGMMVMGEGVGDNDGGDGVMGAGKYSHYTWLEHTGPYLWRRTRQVLITWG